MGFSLATDQTIDTDGKVDASEVESDLLGIGAQWRYYGHAPWGVFFAASLSLAGGEAEGKDIDGRRRTYTLAGAQVSILGIGYQLLAFDRLSLEGSASCRSSLGWLREQGGGDDGVIGGHTIVVAGGVGIAF